MATRVAFQGTFGAHSEEAVRRAFDDADPIPFREHREVVEAVTSGDVEFGLLPIENTVAGSVHASYDAILAEPRIKAVGDLVMPIHHCLAAPVGARLDAIDQVASHPVALAQCTNFFAEHPGIESRAVYSTAGAAEEVARSGDVRRAAMASRSAADRYGLAVLAANVEDRPDNQTRFLVLSRSPQPPAAGTQARTLLVLEAKNRPGSLLELLTPLAERQLNLVKLESRPTGEPWRYRFLVEFEHAAGDGVVDEALAEIEARAERYRNVGTYAVREF